MHACRSTLEDPTDERATVVASAAAERVRFAAPNRIARLRLEVLSASGDVLFEANSRGSVLDWTLSDSQGNRLADGSYLCVVTVKDVAGRIRQRLTLVEIAGGVAAARAATAADLTPRQAEVVGPVETEAAGVAPEAEAPAATLLAHDGRDGQLVTTAGDLSFRGGDFFTGRDKELMRLSADGSLEVAGSLLARGGIRFSDGTVLESARGLSGAGGKGAKAAASAGGGGGAQPSAAGTGSLNFIAKWAETGGAGTLTDSAIVEGAGRVGINTLNPGAALDVAGSFRATGTNVVPTGAAGDGVEMWYWTGSGGPYGLLLSFNRGTLEYKPLWLAGSYISFQQGVTERMRVAENGNIGIGTAVPQSRLEVVGDVRVTGAGSGFVFPDGSKMTTAGGGGVSGTGTANTIPLWTGASTLGNSVVTQLGTNVGIGTSAPAAKLEVVGGANGGVSASSTGGFALYGSNPAGWAVGAEGNTRQSRDRGGWVKAMIYVDQTGAITRCFNSFEADGGAALAGCGFTVSKAGDGVYTVSFPFAVNDRFYSVTAQAASTTQDPRLNMGANFDFDVNPNALIISTFRIEEASTVTDDASFMLVVY